MTDPTKTLQLAMVQGAISGAVSGGIYAMINDTKLSRGILQGMSSGAATGAVMWGIKQSVSKRVLNEEGYLRGKDDPEGAMKTPWANRRYSNLKVDKNGVLVGKLDVGCKRAGDNCTKAFDYIEKINDSKNINIQFNRITIYDDNSDLDLEIKFTRFSVRRVGRQTLGDFTKGIPGGWFTDAVLDLIRIDYGAVYQGNLLHEFGHAIGHAHMVNHSDSVMSYSKNARNYFNQEEINAILKAYK